MQVYLSDSLQQNDEIAKEILQVAKSVRIFFLHGDLGAGKTTLTQSFCSALGVKSAMSSPTFALVNEYPTGKSPIYHFDFYRIRSEIEAYDIGIEEYWDSGAYCFVEWGEKIPSLIPPDAAHLYLSVSENFQRRIELHLPHNL